MTRFLECCCSDAAEAIEAQAGGASRIELCEDLPCGGVTPKMENIKKTLSSVTIPVNVLIRARGGDFVYSEEEIEEMIGSIRLCKELGVNGVVIGALRKDGSLDTDAMIRMISAAQGLSITFHRAFDECADPFAALEEIISLRCNRLLTAGHATNVNDGMQTLKKLQEIADGRIIIMAGSGVRPANIEKLEAETGIKEFHSSSHGEDGRTDRKVVAAMTGSTPRATATYWQIFKVFSKIGAFTIGGGYAMIPLIRDELVRRDWLSDEELPDIVALAQSAPGVMAVNMSIFSGYKLRGVKGSLVATLGSILPSFLIILVIAMVFTGYKDNPVIVRIFKGIRPVVVSLIAVPMINMARKGNKTWWAWAISIITMLLVAFVGFSPIYILLVVIIVSAAIAAANDWRRKRNG